MENNKDFNEINKLKQNVLKKLENKIAIEEFKQNENIEKISKRKSSNIGLKIASFLVITLLLGNVYTFAAYKQNLFSFIISRIGIIENYSEQGTEINEEKISNNNSLTLSSYAFDNESLVITYNLKFDKAPEFFLEDLIDSSKIIDNANTYNLEENHRTTHYKISETEYEFIKIYDLNEISLSDNAQFISEITLYKEFEGPIADKLGKWNFNITLNKNNTENINKKYILENKTIELFDQNGEKSSFNSFNPSDEPTYLKIDVKELNITELGTEIIFNSLLYTDVDYFVEILDENGNVLLENNTEKIISNESTKIIFKAVDLNSKITINIDEISFDGPNSSYISAEGSLTLDLSKDLIIK